ncbi:hypothetical protein AAFN88_08860 [Pelagibius sp. CAU 1746]|uniref:hypothetical protein n=1 Tax=Pelagibius sp. CAU 1746 TaxID=3140370 RepID=UPI00325C0559
MTAAVALASICIFVAAFWLLGIPSRAAAALAVTRGAFATMRDTALDEEAREKEVQRASLKLLRLFFSILGRSLLALIASLLPIWIADALGLAPRDTILLFLARWDVILAVSLALLAAYLLWTRLWPSR